MEDRIGNFLAGIVVHGGFLLLLEAISFWVELFDSMLFFVLHAFAGVGTFTDV